MRIVRLIAVFLGVGLVVAVVGGALVRSAELARDRDLWVETAAEVAALELEAVAAPIDAAAEVASDPGRAVATLAATGVGSTVCAMAFEGGDVVCADGVDPPAALDTAPSTEVVGDELVVTRVGPEVVLAASIDVEGLLGSARVSAASREPVQVEVVPARGMADGAARTVGDRREASRPLDVGPGLMVVASLPDAISFDPAERTLSLTLLVLAVLLLVLAGFTLVAERRHLLERASLDPLTRLPNRGEFEQRGEALVQTALRGGEGVCLMLVDLDGFKAVNDTHGHQAGDEILKVVAMRLRNAVRGYDLVARWGGDEFVLVLQGIDNEVFATSRAGALANLVSERLRGDDADSDGTGRVELQVGASVGIALLGRHGHTLHELVEAADAAMYAAKRAGDQYRLAEPVVAAAAYAGQGVQPTA